MVLDLGRAAEGVLERVRRMVRPLSPGPSLPREERGEQDEEGDKLDAEGREGVMAAQVREEAGSRERDTAQTNEEEWEGIEAAREDEEEGAEDEAERAVRRRRARAVVLDTGRPAAPSQAWRGLPAVEMVRQGIAEADRKRRR